MKISICIPTYNRVCYLDKLFKSLLLNKGLDEVEVIVIDDGSTDSTKTLIDSYSSLSEIKIVYHYQENAGRGVALKRAIEFATGDYTMLMDSDDFFLPDCIEKIFLEIDTHKDFSGFIFLCQDTNYKVIGTKFPNGLAQANLVELYADYNVSGDKKEVVKTEYVKKRLYDNKYNERRVPTSLLWTNISKDISFILVNKPVVIKDYLLEGMTKNLIKLQRKSPHGMFLLNRDRLLFYKYKSLRVRLKSFVGMSYYGVLTLCKYKRL